MRISQCFARSGGATSDTKRQKTTEEDVPPQEPRTIVVWNANSLLSRVDSNRNELRAFIEKVTPDVLFVSEVRMPAAGPPGSKVGDGKPRTHGTLSKATAALAEEAELGLDKFRGCHSSQPGLLRLTLRRLGCALGTIHSCAAQRGPAARPSGLAQVADVAARRPSA